MNNNIPKSPERALLGQQLHDAEISIHLGRKAITELVKQEPIDELAIQQQRLIMSAAREAKRNLLPRIHTLAQNEAPPTRSGWQIWEKW